jgi:cell division protein FtsA
MDSEEVIDELDLERLTENVHKLAMMPGEEIIHVIPQEYKVDGQGDIKEPCGMYGARLEATFHIVVGQVTSIRNIARCVKSSDLELKALNLEPLASAKAVLSQEEKEAGVVLVDIGGGTTDIAIFKDGIIRHTAVIPYGGNIITNDIKEGCSIIEKQAEQLKVKFGSAWPGENKENEIVSIPGLRGRDPKEISLKTLSRIIHARTTEIINAVFTEVKNYGYDQPSRKLIAGVVITGGGSQLKHVKQLVEYLTGMDTRIGYPNEHLAALPLDHALNSPMYATAVGLLMKGLEGRDVEVFVRESDPALSHSPELESTHWDLSPAPAEATEPADEVLVEHLGELETAPAAGGSGADQPQKTKAKGDFFKRWADGFLKLIDDNDLN